MLRDLFRGFARESRFQEAGSGLGCVPSASVPEIK